MVEHPVNWKKYNVCQTFKTFISIYLSKMQDTSKQMFLANPLIILGSCK